MPQSLTPRQQATLNSIEAHIASDGVPPTLAEIALAMGVGNVNGIVKHLRALEAAGVIERVSGQARGIRLVGKMRSRPDTLTIPLLGRVSAGMPIGPDAGFERQLVLDRALFSLEPHYLLRVHGDSMVLDGILDGDLIGVHRSPEARNGQIVVARLDDEITVKRLQSNQDGLRLLPRNPDYQAIEVSPGTDFAIEGLYCGLVRSA